MMRARQQPLFGHVEQRRRPRGAIGKIPLTLYEKIVALRKLGHIVHRVGHDHRFDGRRLKTEMLDALADRIIAKRRHELNAPIEEPPPRRSWTQTSDSTPRLSSGLVIDER